MTGEVRRGGVEEDRKPFDDLYRAAFETRRRLDLPLGRHVFYIDHPLYHRMDVVANAYDDTNITLIEKPETVGENFDGKPYEIIRRVIISRRANGNFEFFSDDTIGTPDKMDQWGYHNTNLDEKSVTLSFDEPVSPEILLTCTTMQDLLQQVTLEQYDGESYDPDYWEDDHYDRKKIKQLKELEEALSTAGGALYLMQLAILMRHRKLRRKKKEEPTYEIPKTNSVYTISAVYDPEEGDTTWHPHIIDARKTEWGSHFGGKKYDHVTAYNFGDHGEYISLETNDYFVHGGEFVTVNTEEEQFDPGDQLPKNAHELVKHMLREIMGVKR